MYKAISIALLSFGFSILAFSNQNHNREHHRNNPELKAEIKKYKQENILPKMKQWKSKIDESLNSEDLQKLNSLRAEAKVAKEEMLKKRKELIAKRESGEDVSKKDIKKLMKESKTEFKSIAEKLRPIAKNNSDLLREIAQEARPFQEKWEEDIKAIFDEYSNNSNSYGEGKRNRNRKGKNKEKGKKAMVRLLLWDGETIDFDNKNSEEIDINSNSIAYPNPFDSNSNITFDLPKEEFVSVKIYDEAGNLIETLYDGNLEKGEQSLNFKPKNNNGGGTYIYRIESESLNETGKLIMNR